MRCCSYNWGLIILVMFGNFAKLDSPRRLVQFWQNFQTSLVLLIPNCTRQRMITYTNVDLVVRCLISKFSQARDRRTSADLIS